MLKKRERKELPSHLLSFSCTEREAENQNVALERSVYPRMVDAAVMVAASEKQGEEFKQPLQCFLASGEDIACGGNGRIEEGKG